MRINSSNNAEGGRLGRPAVLRILGGGLLAAGLLAPCLLAPAPARADIPAGYKGTPYGGTPRALPGRIDFEDYDLGGLNVAWKTDNKAGAAGSSAAGRAEDGEKDHPAFYSTNSNPGEVDKLPDGTLYPTDASPKSFYIGATHATDWANVTVNVAKAGTYWISTHYGGENATYKFSIRFNNVNKTGSISLPGTSNYHNWKPFKNFAKVELEAGVQVMQYMVESQHINWDYLFFSSDSSIAMGVENRLSAGRKDAGAWLDASGNANLLRFRQPVSGRAGAVILDSRGRVLSELFSGVLPAGEHSLSVPEARVSGVRYLRLTRNGSAVALPLSASAASAR